MQCASIRFSIGKKTESIVLTRFQPISENRFPKNTAKTFYPLRAWN